MFKIEIPHHMRNGPISAMTNCEIMGNFMKMFHAQRQNRVGFQSGTSCVTIEFKLNMDGTIFISETSFHIRLDARRVIKVTH